eukprot:3007626-Pleurochrysis_carterae.AAC.2
MTTTRLEWVDDASHLAGSGFLMVFAREEIPARFRAAANENLAALSTISLLNLTRTLFFKEIDNSHRMPRVSVVLEDLAL